MKNETKMWTFEGHDYPAADVRRVQVNVTVGSGMSTRDIVGGHDIAILSAQVADQVMADHPASGHFEVGSARGCPSYGLVRGEFRGIAALQQHAGHGHYRTVAIIGDQGTIIPPRP